MIVGGRPFLASVRNRLAVLIFVITAAAVGFIYLYVVPQLSSNLTAQKLQRLEQVGAAEGVRLDAALRRGDPRSRIRTLVRQSAQRADARVTLLDVRRGPGGPQPGLVVADSQVERPAVVPSYPPAATAAASGLISSSVERIAGARTGETAVPLPAGKRPRWVAVLSAPLGEVDDNVALIRRQILIAGGIALLAALAAGWLAARAHAKRLGRLEAAAQKVAEGDFSTPIPDEGVDEVGQLASTFNEMQQRLARLDSARREFIANASHELRTPIFSLGGFVELLDEEEPDPAVRAEFVRTMREQVARLTKLTADLLDLSKLDSDAMEISAERVDLRQLAERVAEEFGPAAKRHRSPITVDGGARGLALADEDRVAQIMRILLDNALTHTPEGTSITIQAQRSDGATNLIVRDDGPGIDAHERPRVFDRFYTGDRVSGSGLGLAIAHELALRMDGEIGLSSHRGCTEFTLRLPAAAEGVRP
ncbi:MAG TPA: HAMP domain-containing sensor histidine kinase [Solirubrobacterales bacterium]|nr:HAMP domain-containing sensor histidine kinase [Solirubrobacterales bacterium]